ncbi:hypothetical protein F5Y19DRAFT_383276 [Xylariaceae sp. FL1651]|nr:hypothetical protein F5Y19DRAFT_383276 [Xylariaceae sp. FL1651]
MEQTFMTIHNLSPDANILFASESVVDILGYQPQEVQGKSCFDYFHPDEIPFARSVHNRGVLLDKAAVLHYARIMSKNGQWISCECCFTVVHDVLVACTSIYRRGRKSERRAIEAPQIRRIFSSSPRDPRYHMLEHLSPKFKMQPTEREPRAALILNRFTRSLTIMFATNAVSSILGVRPDQLQGKSLYECIAENCLADAIKCLESAKANDSIAYLRFWSRDPRREEDFEENGSDIGMEDEEDDLSESEDSDPDGGVDLHEVMDVQPDNASDHFIKTEATSSPETTPATILPSSSSRNGSSSRLISQVQAEPVRFSRRQVVQREPPAPRREPIPTCELEAVVSCTSDGLVVVLRRARPPIPSLHPPLLPADFENGLFAAPWSEQPIRPNFPPELFYTFQPPLLPQYMPLRDHVKAAGGPPIDQLMKSIRDVAVFAWGLVGINGNLASYSHGIPRGESQPDGLPIWDPNAQETSYRGPEPPSSRRWGAASVGENSAELTPSTRSLYVPSLAAEGGQGYTQSLNQFNSMGPGYSNAPSWPSSSTFTPPSEPPAYSRVQQQSQHHIPEYHDGALQTRWADEARTEAPTSHHRHNTSNDQIPTTQAYSFGDTSQDPRHTWN